MNPQFSIVVRRVIFVPQDKNMTMTYIWTVRRTVMMMHLGDELDPKEEETWLVLLTLFRHDRQPFLGTSTSTSVAKRVGARVNISLGFQSR